METPEKGVFISTYSSVSWEVNMQVVTSSNRENKQNWKVEKTSKLRLDKHWKRKNRIRIQNNIIKKVGYNCMYCNIRYQYMSVLLFHFPHAIV